VNITRTLIIAAAAAGFGLMAIAEMDSAGKRTAGTDSDRAVMAGTNTAANADNTGRNVRDRNDATRTPIDQGNTESDLSLTKQIRKSVMDTKDLSMNARNIKIISNNGQVTLRGPVMSADEKRIIGELAKQAAKDGKVDNQLDVVSEKTDSNRNM
jgi:hyperosmotically inducible protein